MVFSKVFYGLSSFLWFFLRFDFLHFVVLRWGCSGICGVKLVWADSMRRLQTKRLVSLPLGVDPGTVDVCLNSSGVGLILF